MYGMVLTSLASNIRSLGVHCIPTSSVESYRRVKLHGEVWRYCLLFLLGISEQEGGGGRCGVSLVEVSDLTADVDAWRSPLWPIVVAFTHAHCFAVLPGGQVYLSLKETESRETMTSSDVQCVC